MLSKRGWRSVRRYAWRVSSFAALSLVFALIAASGSFVSANGGDDPSPTPTVTATPTATPTSDVDEHGLGSNFVKGPWLSIKQIFWVSGDKGSPPAHNSMDPYGIGANVDTKYTPADQGLLEGRYIAINHGDCYPHYDKGPEADETNSLYLMMSCRIGKVVGALTWAGIGIALLALAWSGLMYVVDSGSGAERAGQLRTMVFGPIVGIFICLFAYVFATMIYSAANYNFWQYLNNGWNHIP